MSLFGQKKVNSLIASLDESKIADEGLNSCVEISLL